MRKFTYDERVSAEAGAWLARLQSDTLSLRDEIAFQAWLDADPAHAAAFEDATGIWEFLGVVPRNNFVAEKSKPRTDRRSFMTGAAALVLAGVATSAFLIGGAKAETYQTAVGEQKQIPLADGTTILLDTDTCVSARFNSAVRLIELKYGRINCHVVQDSRQFAVKAAERLVIGNKSEFDLTNFNDYFSVFLIKGSASVSSADGSAQVGEGERVSAVASHPLKHDKPGRSLLTAWQTGHLIFENETVGDATREMNRYNTVKLEISDPRLAAKRISGRYRAGDNYNFALSLTHLFPIKVLRRANTIELVSSSLT